MLQFRVYQFIITYILLATAIPVILFYNQTNQFSLIHLLLSFFLALNVLICIWEISLSFYIDHIKQTYLDLKIKYKNPWDAVIALFFSPLSLYELFSLKFWSQIWSTYSLYDPSYSNQESYGFFIDFGNGWTTIIPSLLFLFGITLPNKITYFISARTLGIIGILKFYQEFYGTVLYFLSFFFNKRHKGKNIFEVSLFVGLSNGLWFFLPLLGIYTSINMINLNSMEVLY